MKDAAFIYTRITCQACEARGTKTRNPIGTAGYFVCLECHGRGFIETRRRITAGDRKVFNAFFGD